MNINAVKLTLKIKFSSQKLIRKFAKVEEFCQSEKKIKHANNYFESTKAGTVLGAKNNVCIYMALLGDQNSPEKSNMFCLRLVHFPCYNRSIALRGAVV